MKKDEPFKEKYLLPMGDTYDITGPGAPGPEPKDPGASGGGASGGGTSGGGASGGGDGDGGSDEDSGPAPSSGAAGWKYSTLLNNGHKIALT